MDKKNIIIISIIVVAVLIAAVLLFVVNPFSDEPPAVQQETFTMPAQEQPADTQSVAVTEPETEEPVKQPKPNDQEMSEEYDTYIVKEGETLTSIAERLYGDRSKWFKLFAANESEIDWYDTIYVGQKLRIPAPDSD